MQRFASYDCILAFHLTPFLQSANASYKFWYENSSSKDPRPSVRSFFFGDVSLFASDILLLFVQYYSFQENRSAFYCVYWPIARAAMKQRRYAQTLCHARSVRLQVPALFVLMLAHKECGLHSITNPLSFALFKGVCRIQAPAH